MGFYLNGAMDGKPPLPMRGKTRCLLLDYGAEEISRQTYERLRGFNVMPTGMRLVVVRQNGPFDAALVVDKREWDYLHEFPGELVKGSYRYLYVPQWAVDGLITGMGDPDWGDKGNETASA